jgi:hypothetical protein
MDVATAAKRVRRVDTGRYFSEERLNEPAEACDLDATHLWHCGD